MLNLFLRALICSGTFALFACGGGSGDDAASA